MNNEYPDPRLLITIFLCSLFLNSTAQTGFADKVPDWKKTYPKEEVLANVYKETVDFTLDANASPGKPRVTATVSSAIELVPLKDFIKYEDGLFYNDEQSVDNVKVINPDKKRSSHTKTLRRLYE